MKGRLLNVSPEVQQEIAVLLANGDATGADRRLSRYRSNEERDYLIKKRGSKTAGRSSLSSESRLLMVIIVLAVAAALVVWLKFKR
jgi:hypothetical protein